MALPRHEKKKIGFLLIPSHQFTDQMNRKDWGSIYLHFKKCNTLYYKKSWPAVGA